MDNTTTNRKLQKSAVATALIIIVVLAFTLSTATFAWFSSSNRVTVNISEFTADAGGGSLALQWYGLTIPGETEISMDPPQILAPMAPAFRPQFSSLTDMAGYLHPTANEYRRLDRSLEQFYTSTVTPAGDFESDGTQVSPYRTQKTYEGNVYKYMQITAGSDITTGVQITAAFADADNQDDTQKGNHERLRVAVYQYLGDGSDVENDQKYFYIGTLGHQDAETTDNDKRIAYGKIVGGTNAGETGYMYKGATINTADPDTQKNYDGSSTQATVNFYLPADSDGVVLKGGSSLYLTCVVWYDGNLLTSTHGAGGTASVKLSFSII